MAYELAIILHKPGRCMQEEFFSSKTL